MAFGFAPGMFVSHWTLFFGGVIGACSMATAKPSTEEDKRVNAFETSKKLRCRKHEILPSKSFTKHFLVTIYIGYSLGCTVPTNKYKVVRRTSRRSKKGKRLLQIKKQTCLVRPSLSSHAPCATISRTTSPGMWQAVTNAGAITE